VGVGAKGRRTNKRPNARAMTATDPEMDVDMEALRAKYSRPREQLVAEAQAKYGSNPAGYVAQQRAAESKGLKEVVICPGCQAQGTVKRQYGFRVIDEVRAPSPRRARPAPPRARSTAAARTRRRRRSARRATVRAA
jgi:hypothetical protein